MPRLPARACWPPVASSRGRDASSTSATCSRRGAKAAAVRWTLRLTADLIVFNSRFTRDRFGPTRPATCGGCVSAGRRRAAARPSAAVARDARSAARPRRARPDHTVEGAGRCDPHPCLGSETLSRREVAHRRVGRLQRRLGRDRQRGVPSPAPSPGGRARGRRRGRAHRAERRSQGGARVARRAARPLVGGALRAGRRGGHGGRRAGGRDGRRRAEGDHRGRRQRISRSSTRSGGLGRAGRPPPGERRALAAGRGVGPQARRRRAR